MNLTYFEIKERLISIIENKDTSDTELLRCVKALYKEDPKYTVDKLNEMLKKGQKTEVVLCELLKITPKPKDIIGESGLNVRIN